MPVYPAHSSLTFHRNELLSREHNSPLPHTADKEAPVSTLSFRAKSALSKPETRRVKVIFTVLARDKNQQLNTQFSVAEGFLIYN